MGHLIDISGPDKAAVLAALYNHSKPLGMGRSEFAPGDMSVQEARACLEDQSDSHFDYLDGRFMKVDLGGDSFSPYLYDRNNGPGTAEKVARRLRETGSGKFC